MGNQTATCACPAQRCLDELALALPEPGEPECDPAGTIFNETLEGLTLVDQELLRFAGTANLSAVRWILAVGASIGAHDSQGTTLLHASCRSGSSSVVRELLHHRAALNQADLAGWTPLHVAAAMGRRPLVALLLQRAADPGIKNSRGSTPVSLCRDPGTREVLKGNNVSIVQSIFPASSKGSLRVDTSDGNTYCVPFFVPRQPLLLDRKHTAELAALACEMLDRSVGHGLAFCVATGVVRDRPTDLSLFLLEQRTDPQQLGEFLGEELSMSETLRLAFMDSMDLSGTGVVSALCRAFRHIHVPQSLGKIDRLTAAIAQMWWRAHEGPGPIQAAVEGAQRGTALDAAVEGAPEDLQETDMQSGSEMSGWQLRRHMLSVDGMQRLLFSTVMLCWSLHGSATSSVGNQFHNDPLSLRRWLDVNAGIEADGTSTPELVLEHIYRILSMQAPSSLLCGPAGDAPPKSGETRPPVQGWASIPHGGLERCDPSCPAGAAALAGMPRLAKCILSEAPPAAAAVPRAAGTKRRAEPSVESGLGTGAEMVWLSLRFSFVLFLATSPADVAPYAFVHLEDTVLRNVDRQSRQLILARRPLKAAAACSNSDTKGDTADAILDDRRNLHAHWSPFGDPEQLPLQLCFLLRDGRFQSFATLWLELHFSTDEELELWLQELGAACQA